jgi:gluconate 2-dehydrogenase gamma chain
LSKLARRDLLAGTAWAFLHGAAVKAGIITGALPWTAATPPSPTPAGHPWLFLTSAEAAMLEAIADRLIPPDPETFGGKQAGCVVFIDRQLAGPYGQHAGWYNQPPFRAAPPEQGPQSALNPAQLYRRGLQALENYCRSSHGASWVALPPERQEQILQGLEHGSVQLAQLDTAMFFETVLKDVQEGFFADPIYGGNRDLCSWKMIGFPGAHYDYRDWVGKHNQRYPYPPVGIGGRPEWMPRRN